MLCVQQDVSAPMSTAALLHRNRHRAISMFVGSRLVLTSLCFIPRYSRLQTSVLSRKRYSKANSFLRVPSPYPDERTSTSSNTVKMEHPKVSSLLT